MSCLRRVGSPGACARLGVGRRGGCGYRARLWCGTRCVDARGSPSVLGRPALITTQSDRLVCPLSREKNLLALAVLLRGSDRCPTHVGSGCGRVAGVVAADWSRRLFTSSGVRLRRGEGEGEGLRRGHMGGTFAARAVVCVLRSLGDARRGKWACSRSASRWMCSAVCAGFRDGACGDWCVGRRRSRERVIWARLIKVAVL